MQNTIAYTIFHLDEVPSLLIYIQDCRSKSNTSGSKHESLLATAAEQATLRAASSQGKETGKDPIKPILPCSEFPF